MSVATTAHPAMNPSAGITGPASLARPVLRWPYSLRSLAWLGFAWVTAPLLTLLVIAAVALNALARDGGRLVHQAVASTQHSRMLMEQLVAMERNARQFAVLDDPTLLALYRDERARFLEAAASELALSVEPERRARLQSLLEDEAAAHVRLLEAAEQAGTTPQTLAAFAGLNAEAAALWQDANTRVGARVRAWNEQAAGVRRSLLWQAALLVPLALLLAGVFAHLITRPIRDLDRVIHRLGDERFDEPLRVEGPRDLRYLGERLDWLRGRLRELEQNKKRFLRDVSHDLKTPLTTLREGTGLLAEEVVGALTPEQREITEILRQSAEQLHGQIEDLLGHGWLEAGQGSLNAQWIELPELIDAVVSEHRLAARARGQVLRTRTDALRLWGDAERIRNLLRNLLGNALKYGPPDRPVAVQARRSGHEAVIEVVDHGPGIHAEERERVFEPFVRGGRARAEGVGGTGLGLTIVREIVQAHHGRVALRPTPGGGTTVVVALPLDFREPLE